MLWLRSDRNNMFINFNPMIPRCCAQILPDGINRGIGKPFMECLHDKLSRDITADVILESYVPSKVLK